MTLQERLRSEDAHDVLSDPLMIADALDAKDERIRELEGALRELMRVDEIGRDPNTNAESWRPLKRAAWERAREALK